MTRQFVCGGLAAIVLLCLIGAFVFRLNQNRFRFSLRSLGAATFFVCVALALWQAIAHGVRFAPPMDCALAMAAIGAALGAISESVWLGIAAALAIPICSFVILFSNVGPRPY